MALSFIRQYNSSLHHLHGAEVFDELHDFNKIIEYSVKPSEPYLIDLEKIKEELYFSGNVYGPALGYLIVESVKVILILTATFCYTYLIKE